MKKGISQEGLKLIACLTMLIDHIGYEILYPLYASVSVAGAADMPEIRLLYRVYLLSRCIGWIAFPIFAFLLVEGVHHTRNRKKYAIRLVIGALLAEIPFDLVVSGKTVWHQQSVMVTLLLGFCAVLAMERCRSLGWKPVVAIPFALAAEMLRSDYGWTGVALVVLFELSRQMYSPNLVRTGGMIVLFHYTASRIFHIGNFSLPMQVLGALSMLFIGKYDGRKVTTSKAAQWAFYLFYPVHLMALWGIGRLLKGVFMFGISIAI